MISEKDMGTGAPVYTSNNLSGSKIQEQRGAPIVNRQPIPDLTVTRMGGAMGHGQRDATSDSSTTVAQDVRMSIEDSYQRARPGFEADFAGRAQAEADKTGAGRAFAQAEPNYRAGFMAGHDLQYEGRTFEEIEPDLRREYETSVTGTGEQITDGAAWERLREEIRAGFHAARNALGDQRPLRDDARRTAMSEQVNLDTIEPGMPVFGAEGAKIGPVEAIHPTSINVASHEVPREAITYVDREGVHLQLGKIALMARPDPDVEGADSLVDFEPARPPLEAR